MYTILLVDDERIVREGIRDTIVEHIDDAEVIVASDGEEALEVMSANRVDGMILDVKMPNMDGIEVLRRLERDIQEKPITMILSGYDEFNYAQEAIRFGVQDFVLKPVTPFKVVEVVRELIKKIETEHVRKREIATLRDQVEQSKPLLKERFLLDLIEGKFTIKEFRDKCEFLGLQWPKPFFRIALIELNTGASDQDQTAFARKESDNQYLLKSLENMIVAMAVEKPEFSVFYMHGSMFALVFNVENGDRTSYSSIESLLQEISERGLAKLGVKITIGVGDYCDGYRNMRRSYHQAKNALDYQSLMGSGLIYDILDYEKSSDTFDFSQLVDEIVLLVKMERVQEAREAIVELFKSLLLLKEMLHIQHVYLVCYKLICSFLTILMEHSIDFEEIYSNSINPLIDILNKRSFAQLEQFIIELTESVAAKLREHRNSSTVCIVERIKQYISLHYTEEINNTKLAELFGYSSNYLGQIFKRETNRNISDYLNGVRVKEAKELLKKTNLLVYEIAFKVGFNDQHYFSSVFKKNVGLSPKDYRNI